MGALQAVAVLGAGAAAGGAAALRVDLSTTYLERIAAEASFSTASVSTTVTGGTGPFTSSWAIVAGSSAIQPSSPNTPSTAFSLSNAAYAEYSADAQLTVTDANGAVAKSPLVSVYMARTRGGVLQ